MERFEKFAIRRQAITAASFAIVLTWCLEQPGFCGSVSAFDEERNAGYRDLISKEYAEAEAHYLNAFEQLKASQEAPYKVALLNAEYADVLVRLDRNADAVKAYARAIAIAEEWLRTAPVAEKFGFDRDLSSMKRRLALCTDAPQLERRQSSITNNDTMHAHKADKSRRMSNQRIAQRLRQASKLTREDQALAAIQILQKAIHDCKTELGAERDKPTWQNHRLLLKCLDQLGRAYLAVNELPQARDVLFDSYKLKQRLLWTGFPSLLETTCLLGVALARLGERSEGRELLESSLKHSERLSQRDREDARYYLLVLTEQDGRLSEAHALLSKYIDLTVPDKASPARRYDLLSGLAARLTQDAAPNLGDFCAKRASIALKKMESPDDKDQYANQLLRADALLRAGRFAEGEAICHSLQNMKTTNLLHEAACYRLLAYAQYQLHNFEQAEATIEKALILNEAVIDREPKGYEETFIYATQIAESQPDITKLEKLLDKLSNKGTKKIPGLARIKANSYMTLSHKEWKLHRYEKAQKHFSEAYSQWTVLPLELRANLGIAVGDIAMTLDQPLLATTCYQECQKAQEAIPKHISNRAFHWRLGFALSRLGRWDESKRELQQVLRETVETNDVGLEMKALATLLECHLATHQYEEANRLIDVYSKKSNSVPARALASYTIGRVKLAQGKVENSRKALADAALYFARLGGDYATKLADCYAKIAAGYPPNVDSLKWLNKAIAVYTRMDMDQGEEVAATYLEAGKIYAKLNSNAAAATAFNTAAKAIKYSNSPSALVLKSEIRRRQRAIEGQP